MDGDKLDVTHLAVLQRDSFRSSTTGDIGKCEVCGKPVEFRSHAGWVHTDVVIANSRQVAGDHYKQADPTAEEHWDRIWRTRGLEGGRGYFIGCITKYVERYDQKAGVTDLKKAIHYIQKLIELEETSTTKESDKNE